MIQTTVRGLIQVPLCRGRVPEFLLVLVVFVVFLGLPAGCPNYLPGSCFSVCVLVAMFLSTETFLYPFLHAHGEVQVNINIINT